MTSRPAVYEFADPVLSNAEVAENTPFGDPSPRLDDPELAVMTAEETDRADHSDQEHELAELLLLPVLPVSPVEHARQLVALALTMLAEGRVGVATGVLHAHQKVLAVVAEVDLQTRSLIAQR